MTPLSFSETRAQLARDRAKLRAWRDECGAGDGWPMFDPSYQAVWLHRWSRFFFVLDAIDASG